MSLSEPAHSHRRIAPNGLLALLLALGVSALYLPAADNGFVYDDHDVIEAQPKPDGAAALGRVFAEPHFHGLPYYRPLTRLTLLAQKALHGDAPLPFHVVNALLAGAAAAAAFALLRTPALALARGPAAAAAALFAIHPVASSCVYPAASGRETLLPSLLMLLAVAAFVRERRLVAHAALGLALFAKEQAAVTPLLFLLADACRLSGQPPPPTLAAWLRRHASYFALLFFYLWIRASVLGESGVSVAWSQAPLGPLLSWLYGLQVWLVPFADLLYEPEWPVWSSLGRAGIALALAGGLVFAAYRSRLGAPGARPLAFWLAWFVVVQSPTSNWLHQEARFAERYVFLASLALPALAAGVAARAWTHWELPPVRAAIRTLAALLLVAAGWLSIGRAETFRNDQHFAEQWLATNPESPEAHHLLGLLRAQAGDLDAAQVFYEEALALGAESADLQHNLGTALAMEGHWERARIRFEEALRLQPSHPEANSNLSALHLRAGRIEEALRHARAALAVAPTHAAAHHNLGAALAQSGETDEAAGHFTRALAFDPSNLAARRDFARLREQQGLGREALQHYRAILEQAPGDAESLARVRALEAADR